MGDGTLPLGIGMGEERVGTTRGERGVLFIDCKYRSHKDTDKYQLDWELLCQIDSSH